MVRYCGSQSKVTTPRVPFHHRDHPGLPDGRSMRTMACGRLLGRFTKQPTRLALIIGYGPSLRKHEFAPFVRPSSGSHNGCVRSVTFLVTASAPASATVSCFDSEAATMTTIRLTPEGGSVRPERFADVGC